AVTKEGDFLFLIVVVDREVVFGKAGNVSSVKVGDGQSQGHKVRFDPDRSVWVVLGRRRFCLLCEARDGQKSADREGQKRAHRRKTAGDGFSGTVHKSS